MILRQDTLLKAFKYLNYQDSQPDQDRIGVNAYSVMVMTPIAGKWAINSSYTYDSVSGASPTHHDTLSGASIEERRNAGDLSVTRYLEKGSMTIGTSYSSESDYKSHSYSFQRSFLTEDNNTTFTLGGSYTDDTINAYKKDVYDKKKRIYSGFLGITKVLSKKDIMQLNVGFSKGDGYFSDPYKDLDLRPDKRDITTLLTRWNHHFDASDGTVRLGYRYYTDSFDISAHTFSAEYVQPLPHELTVTPLLRFSSQSAAYFYKPVGAALDFSTVLTSPSSLDERLSAFGAVTVGLKVEKKVAADWTVDVKFEQYEQRGEWCLTGKGDSGLQPFSFRSIQLGVSRQL